MKKPQMVISIFQDFWSKLINNRTEPQVWHKRDRAGNTYWQVFDPVTGYFTYFSSEQEVRIWIEERYYRHAK